MAAVRNTPPTQDSNATLLELFYPMHYKLGMALEDALRGGRLSRKQVAILWLIRAEGGQEYRMQRKEIERLLSTWHDVSSSAITKALRALSRPPLELVQIVEDPQSGREKQVFLTPKGKIFLQTMVTAGRQYLADIVGGFAAPTTQHGIAFLSQVSAVLDRRPTDVRASKQRARPA